MTKPRRSVFIKIDDLDNEQQVLAALGNLFTTIFTYYLETNSDLFLSTALNCGKYFGYLLQAAGFTAEDFKPGENDE